MLRTQRISQKESFTKKNSDSFTILIIDPQDIIASKLQREVQSGRLLDQIEIVSSLKADDVLKILRSGSVEILIGVNLDPKIWYVTLELTKEISAQTVRILISDSWTNGSLNEAINRVNVFRILETQVSLEELRLHLHAAVVEANLIRSQQNLLKEAKSQNKELENLNLRLEKTVEERTQHIQKSKEELDDRLNQVRHIIRLIKELSRNINFEEWMGIVRKEFRRFQKIGEPILILHSVEKEYEVMTYNANRFSFVSASSIEPWTIANEIVINNKHVSRNLANLFGRPFVQLTTMPLDLRLIKKTGLPQANAWLCIESSMNESEYKEFMNYLGQLLRPLSMSADRLFLETELLTKSSRWEKTFDGLPDPIAIIDVEYNVLRSNNKFSDRVIQKKCYDVFAGRNSICPSCPLATAIHSKAVQKIQTKIKDRYYEIGSYPIRNVGDSITTVVHQYVDVTQSKMLYGRMLQNEKMSAVGMLAGNIAHELNNPLSGIRSMAQVLMTETPSEQIKNDLKEVEKAAARSQKIIKNLLEFSSGSHQKTELISIDEIVDRTMPMMKSLIRPYKNVVVLNAKNHFIEIDVQLMQQVIFNLVHNACQAMGERGTLSIRTEIRDLDVILFIEDSGPGVPNDIKDRIFEPFFTTKEEGHGTGLGLSLSRDIVRKFGGDISLLSEHGKGATLIVQLPIKK